MKIVSKTIPSIYEIKKWKTRKVKQLVQVHTAGERQSWDLDQMVWAGTPHNHCAPPIPNRAWWRWSPERAAATCKRAVFFANTSSGHVGFSFFLFSKGTVHDYIHPAGGQPRHPDFLFPLFL